ncbi:UNVERIFIED_CONTAM: KRRI-Interacting protein 1 [Siphonaria sp. JEL0065]|nr:KRRI-Interacting protein 1 [Siphonaria sp. JEL0065]
MKAKPFKKSKQSKAKDIADEDNPNMIPVPSRGSQRDRDHQREASSDNKDHEDPDDVFSRMAPVDKAEIVTMDLSDPEDEDAAFNINKAFASKYEERKKAEEISFLKDRYGENYDQGDSGSDSESDEEEDENGELLTKELDLQILKTIGIIRAKNPEIYDPKKVFFSADDVKKSEDQWKEKQESKQSQGKKVTLKDYHRQRLLEGGYLEGDEDEQEEDAPPVTKTYLEEQEDLKNSFKQAFANDDEDDDEDDLLVSKSDSNRSGGLFTVRQKSKAELDQEEADYKTFLVENIKKDGVLKEWTEDGGTSVDPSEKFLMDFILNKQWVDEEADEDAIPTYDQIVREEHIDEDEAGEDEVDRFEHAYNFRFEEADGANIQTFSRLIEDTMRRKDTTRAEKRAAIKARKVEEKKAKEEELKRLKNLKKEELRIKLQKIADVAGTDASVFESLDLEEDFDPTKFDEMMAARFNENYYETNEEAGAAAVGLMKPVFDDGVDLDDVDYGDYEDDGPPPIEGLIDEGDFELDGLVDRSLGPKAGEGKVLKIEKPIDRLALLAQQEEEEKLKKKEAKDKKRKRKQEEEDGNEDTHEEEEIIMDADYLPGGEYYGEEEQPTGKKSKKDKKKELKEKKKAAKQDSAQSQSLDQYLDEYLKLDHEDMIGDLATRFKYRKVEPEDYGLSAVEILLAPDTALNEYVPLKHIAPFRPEQRKQKDKEIWSKTKKKKMKKLKDALEAAKVGKTLEEWENDKREKKRKAEQAEKKLGQAAKKAAKRAKKAEEGGPTNVETGDTRDDGDVSGDVHMEVTESHQEIETSTAEKPEASNTVDANKKSEKKKNKKKGVVKLTGATSMKGGVTSERLASYGIPSHKK